LTIFEDYQRLKNTISMSHRFSVATICFNNLSELKRTIASVDQQASPPDEHLIIDGSTTRAILEYLEQEEHPAYRHWISEKDKGITDAFNKGVFNASGDVVHLLNSGDYYYDHSVLERVKTVFENDPEVMWTHGQYLQQVGGEWVITGEPFNPQKLYRGFGKVGHPTMFVKKKLYEKHGYFDLSYRHSMDYDFLVRIRHEPFVYIPYPITVFTPGGNSNINWKPAFQEVVHSYTTHIGWDVRIIWGYIYQVIFNNLIHTKLGRFLLRWKYHQKT
jgi:glycosyltransferase involved in cell wall biosynthesis